MNLLDRLEKYSEVNLNVFEKAMQYAAICHRGMTRRIGNTPYILHPMEAAVIASGMTDDPDVLAAAVLHDTVEDTDATAEDIRTTFGDKVADLVAAETEDKMTHLPSRDSWKARKIMSLKVLHDSDDINVKILWLSDKLSNVRSFYRMYRELGPEMWKSFNQTDIKEQEWYYRAVESELGMLKGYPAMDEYSLLLDKIFNAKEDQ